MNQKTHAILTYIAQMLWLISAQLHTLTGEGEYPIPDAMSLTDARETAWPDKAALLSRLKGGAPHAD